MKKIICILLMMGLFAPLVFAQDTGELYEFLRPTLLKIGILPNMDGMLDGNFGTTLRWNKVLTTSVAANYSGSSQAVTEETDTVKLSSKTFSKNADVDLKLLDFMLPVPATADTGFGFSAALTGIYSGLFQSTSGYKTAQAETIFFNQDKTIHKIMPTVDFGFSGVFSRALTFEVTGAFLPYIIMLENGTKLYSTYDEEIPYSLNNSCMGWKAGLSLATLKLPGGNFSFKGGAIGMFGTYNTRQDVVTGNYKTTIETTTDYLSIGITASLEYKPAFLKKLVSVSPAISLGYTYFEEAYGDSSSAPLASYKVGMSLSSK